MLLLYLTATAHKCQKIMSWYRYSRYSENVLRKSYNAKYSFCLNVMFLKQKGSHVSASNSCLSLIHPLQLINFSCYKTDFFKINNLRKTSQNKVKEEQKLMKLLIKFFTLKVSRLLVFSSLVLH